MSTRGTGLIPGNAASVNNTERGVDRGNMDSGFSRPGIASYGLPEAPIDGNQYVRKDAQWFAFSGTILPSDVTPLSNADTGSAGVATTYARGDHVHPAVTVSAIPGLSTTLGNLATKDTEHDGLIAAKQDAASIGSAVNSKIAAGTNVTLAYNPTTQVTTINSTATGGGVTYPENTTTFLRGDGSFSNTLTSTTATGSFALTTSTNTAGLEIGIDSSKNVYIENKDAGSVDVSLRVNGVKRISATNQSAFYNDGIREKEIGFKPLVFTSQATGYTLVASDANTGIACTAALTLTFPANVFQSGDVITVINASSSNVTLGQGTSLTLRLAGTATTGSRTLAQRGMATVFYYTTTDAYASGVGLT